MKTTHKFSAVFLTLTLLFSLIFAFVTVREHQILRQNSNAATAKLIGAIKEKYPEVSNDELAKILNSENNPKNSDFLRQYGINLDEEWAESANNRCANLFVTVNAVLCSLCGLSLCAVYLLYRRNRKKEICRITEYMEQINRKNYDLAIDENSEDELSLLKNEIYKTTVMLKEQSEISKKDKENLKESLSDISHQLKTPLTSIMVMVDNLTDNEDMPSELRKEFLEDIHREANNIKFLVNSILTLSKMDANTIVFKSNPENLGEIIEKAKQNTEVLSELKGVEVLAEYDKKAVLSCDFKWLSEAVTNIVKNCIEHTQEGGKVKIRGEQNKLYTKIVISDNGCGIDSKDLPHIFERFYKGKNSSDESVGIGLALAKTIAEKSGGYISADSKTGKGSVFTICLYQIIPYN